MKSRKEKLLSALHDFLMGFHGSRQALKNDTFLHIRKLLVRDLRGMQREINAFPDDASVWETPPSVSNCAGILAMHGCGNLNHFIGHVLGGNGYMRDREKEFSNQGLSRAEISAEFDRTIAAMESVLPRLDPARLSEPFPLPIAGNTLNTQLFLTHLCVHLAFHLGQLGYLRRFQTGDNTSTSPVMPTELV